ncbi:MAG: metallophosphoesterase [Planctomycetota bacterium]|jgi:hypothetical protein
MTPVSLQDASSVSALFKQAAAALRDSPHRRGSMVRLPAQGRLLATGDLHDNHEHLRRIVHLARLEASPDHHVVLHELVHSEVLVNGVDLSHRMLARVAQLVIDYPAQVHVLLGNHELAQLTGQRVSKGAGDNVALFNAGLEFAFGDDGPSVAESINRFITAMPLAAGSESGLLCAHSLPGSATIKRFDPEILSRELTDEDYASRTGSAYLMVWGRGFGEQEVEALAERWRVRLFVLGHEHTANGLAVRGGRVVILNSDHELGTVVPIDLACVPDVDEVVQLAVRLRSIPPPQDHAG